MANHPDSLREVETARLRALHLSSLRVDLHLTQPQWRETWHRAIYQSNLLDVALELALHLPKTGNGNLDLFQEHLNTHPPRLTRVLALREGEPATTHETLRLVRQALTGFNAPIGAGSDANFCELYREHALGRLPTNEADFIFWSINPQVHAFDPLSIMETLEAQGNTVQTARAFAGHKPLVISPVTLKPRFNAVATSATAQVAPGELPPPVDPRQLSLFTAAWTLGSLAALFNTGVEGVTFFEATGWRGIMETERGSPLPEKFPSPPGAVFPVYHVFADLADAVSFAPAQVSDSSQVAALTIFDHERDPRLLVANLTPKTQRLRLLTSAPAVQARLLTADTALRAMAKPEQFRAQPIERWNANHGAIEIDLPAYAYARINLMELS